MKQFARPLLGYLEEFVTAVTGTYVGNRVVEKATHALGAQNARNIVLQEDVTIFRGFNRRVIKLKAGTSVRVWLTPLEGKETHGSTTTGIRH